MRIRALTVICLAIIIMLNDCKFHPSVPSRFSTCTFVIPGLQNYDCYLNKAGTGRKIKLSINLVTKYENLSNSGPNYLTESDVTIHFDPTANSFPLQINALIPNDPSTTTWPWNCEVNISGEECSTCAGGYGYPGEATGACPAIYINGSNPPMYQAAKPQWQVKILETTYMSSFTFGAIKRNNNVPNSCTSTCITP
jgi:hypothetical protein